MGKIVFEDVLTEKRSKVWPVIEKYLNDLTSFPDYCRIPQKYSSLSSFHQKMVSDYPQRKGKYLRPTLVLLTAEAMGFPQGDTLQTAAAMQVSEDWILNHDDIEDDSLRRRGKPALHKLYGKELAINAGDGLHVLMWKMLLDNLARLASTRLAAKPAEVSAKSRRGYLKGTRIMEEFYQMLNRTVLGQTIEIKWTQEGKMDLSDEDILFILESKTGYYTIAGPMRLGAILAGASEKQLTDIYEFGKVLGRSFQIVDDLLDLTSDFKGQKKQTGNDIYEGKRTIILMHLFQTISAGDKKKLLAIMEKPREKKTEKEVKWVVEKMREYGSLDYSRKMAEKFAKEAEKIFEKKLGFLDHQPAREQLKAGIDFIVKRKY